MACWTNDWITSFWKWCFVCKQFEIEYADGKIKEGAGILVKETSCSWIPQGFMVYSVVAEKHGGQFKDAINPF